METQHPEDLRAALALNLALRRDLEADVAVREVCSGQPHIRGRCLLLQIDARVAELRSALQGLQPEAA